MSRSNAGSPMCRALSARNFATTPRAPRSQSVISSRRAGSMNVSQMWLRDVGSRPGSQLNTRGPRFQAR